MTQDEVDVVATAVNMSMESADAIELVELSVSELSRSYSSILGNYVPGVIRSASCLDSCDGWMPDGTVSKDIPQFVTMDIGYVEKYRKVL